MQLNYQSTFMQLNTFPQQARNFSKTLVQTFLQIPRVSSFWLSSFAGGSAVDLCDKTIILYFTRRLITEKYYKVKRAAEPTSGCKWILKSINFKRQKIWNYLVQGICCTTIEAKQLVMTRKKQIL